jgi:predicted TIM-barrel fold metal-dependent hydrolase
MTPDEPLDLHGSIIDCQCHLFIPETLQRLRQRRKHPRIVGGESDETVVMGPWHRRIGPQHTDLWTLIETMESSGISRNLISPNDPGPEWFGNEALEVAKESNDFIAAIVREDPGRFLGIGVLPLPDVPSTLDEMKRGVEELGLKGFLLYTNILGQFPDEPQFSGVFSRAEELGVALLLHPSKPISSAVFEEHEMISAVGNMFEDTVALLRLILSGVLDRHPSLKLVCPHLGGTLPYVFGRLEHQMNVLGRGPRDLECSPLDYLQRIYFDIVSPQPSAMRLLIDLVGTKRLVFGSDYPWVRPSVILGALQSLDLDPADMKAILYENANKLFGENS